jgi:hydroxymethylglutaryl-CoA lyase/(R)-citramalyl-CoA lyase
MEITLCDVGPRDGLQNDEAVLEPAVRAELCERLAATGLRRVEAASFVNPRLVPQMAGAEEVFAALPESATTWAALVLNRRGFDRAVSAGAEEIHVAYPVTETFARRNQNVGVEEAAAAAAEIIDAAHETGLRVTATLAASFGCPFEGKVDPAVVADHAQRMAAADEVLLADTIGVGVPVQVRRLVRQVGVPVGANAYAGLEEGVTLFDASVGGLGGCPFAPRATGNIATEDLLYLLEGEGVDTGVDLDGVIGVAEWLSGILGRPLPGLLHRV